MTGCEHRCHFCYARRFAVRHGGNPRSGLYHALVQRGLHPFTPAFDAGKLERMRAELARARKPRRVFLGSMADLGGDWAWWRPDATPMPGAELRALIADTIAGLPRHTFLILTKNPAGLADTAWPANCHVGVSVTDTHPVSRDRIRWLPSIAGNCLRWVSVEPLLDPAFDGQHLRGVDWVVIGAQTGPGARVTPTIVEAAQRIVSWCAVLGVPCFVKDNLVRWAPEYGWPRALPEGRS